MHIFIDFFIDFVYYFKAAALFVYIKVSELIVVRTVISIITRRLTEFPSKLLTVLFFSTIFPDYGQLFSQQQG